MGIHTEEPKKLPVYALGAIPDEWAWPGQALEFVIDTRALDENSVTMSIDETTSPAPVGTCALDTNGSFTFDPDPADTYPIRIEFRGTDEGKEVAQCCTFTPVPALPAERDQITRPGSLPARDSSLYLTTSTTRNADESEDHVVSGMRLVFDKKIDTNRLMERYHHDRQREALPNEPTVKGTIRNLTIIADEVEVNGELALPETNVQLLARRLIFRDQDGIAGSINTSPLPFKNARAEPSADGAHGRKAGDISVFVRELDAGGRDRQRFSLRGGRGQGAGLGEDGDDGQDNPDFRYEANYGSLSYAFDPPAIHFRLECCIWGPHGATGDTWNWGSLTWPTTGNPATPPGAPGNASDGGNFTGNLIVTEGCSPGLADQVDRLRAAVEALSPVLDHAVLDGMALAYQNGRLDKVLSRESATSLQAISKSLEDLLNGITAAQQTCELEKATAVKKGLTSARRELIAARQKAEDARKQVADSLKKRMDAAERKKAARFVSGTAVRMRRSILKVQTGNLLATPFTGEVDAHAGPAGDMACDVTGGRAGYPKTCGNWDIRCYDGFDCKLHRSWNRCVEQRTTEDGASYAAPHPARPVGTDGTVLPQRDPTYRNAWLHPLLLQTVMLYVRDAYLAVPEQVGQLQPILEDYRAALEGRPHVEILRPIVERAGCSFDDSAFEHAHTEISTILHRMASHLDYFGNPSAWTPLFSLPVCLRMYENELDYGLRALLLSRWIGKKAAGAEEIIRLSGQSIDSLYTATDQAVEEIEQQQGRIKQLNDRASALRQEITDLTVRLDHKRSELLDKAEEDARIKSWVELGVSTISAITQVIPYGQPVLGTLGSMGKVIAENAINGKDPIQDVGPLTDMLGGLAKVKLDEKAGEITAAAKKKGKEKSDARAEQAAATAKKLKHVGKAIGPALNDISTAIQGVAVPYAEVDARLRKLEAECPEFQELVNDLRKLNLRKLDFAQRLCEAVQSLSLAFVRITNNLLSVAALQQHRRREAEVLDHEALLYARTMEQDARATLAKYLYYLAKSGEYALLKPIPVDYRLTEITDRILPLLEKDDEPKGITQLCGEIKALFESQMHEIEKVAFQHFEMEYEDVMEIRLSVDQTPDLIRELNDVGATVVNLRDLNCVWPGHEQARIADVEIGELEFDAPSGRLPSDGTVELTLEPRGEGTIRAGNTLYVVRHPTSETSAAVGRDSQQLWGGRYHFGEARLEAIKPTASSLALLDYLLHDTPRQELEKIAKPAAWTEVTVRYTRHVASPDLKSIRFKLKLYSKLASRQYCTLDVRTGQQHMPLIRCSVADVNGRSHGFGDLYRIYPAGQRLRLIAPASYGMSAFGHWIVIENTDTMKSREVQSSVLEIDRIDSNMLVYCHFMEQEEVAARMAPDATLRAIRQDLSALPADVQESIAQFASFPGGDDVGVPPEFGARVEQLLAQGRFESTPPGQSSCILNKPGGVSVGYLPKNSAYTVLDGPTTHDEQKWSKIDFQGVVGWMSDVAVEPGHTGGEEVASAAP